MGEWLPRGSPRSEENASCGPSCDQTGSRSSNGPHLNWGRVWPSGATATAIEVPSWTSTSMGAASDGVPARAPTLRAASTLHNASRSVLQLMGVLQASYDDVAFSHADTNLAGFCLPPTAGAWGRHHGGAEGGMPQPVLHRVPGRSVRHKGPPPRARRGLLAGGARPPRGAGAR